MRRFNTAVIWILTLSCGSLGAQVMVPSENPENWILAFVDVETTGLTPGYHEMIDIGMVLSDLEGNEIDRLFLRMMPNHPDRLSPGAAAVNGFSVERWDSLGAPQSQTALDSIVGFIRQHSGGRHMLMVAYNSAFDAAFLDHLFRLSGDYSRDDIFYYYVLDLPSMAWSQGIRLLHGAKLAEYFGIPDEPRTPEEHTGITGADLNYRIYKKLLQYSRRQ